MDPEVFLETQRGPHEMSIRELSKEVALFAKSGIDVKEREMTLNLKISLPFACFITCLIAAPLSVKSPKSGGLVGIAISILIILVYYGLLSVFWALGKNGVLPAFVAAWIPNIAMGALGGALIWQEER
jgi:lipopolysaccharide export system permease protein